EEVLPSREALRARRVRFPGLTRPELALVTAYTKLDLSRRLEETRLLDDSYLTSRFLLRYFPASIAEQFVDAIPAHRLRRELSATMIANEVVDSMGSTFLFALELEYLAKLDRAVSSWLIAGDVLGIRHRVEWLKSEQRGFTAIAETEAMLALEGACRAGTVWALRNHAAGSAIGATIERFQPAFEQLSATFESGLAGGDRERFEQTYRRLRETIGDGDVAHDLGRLVFAGDLLTILSLSVERGIDPGPTAETWFALSAQFEFGRLHDALTASVSEDRWE